MGDLFEITAESVRDEAAKFERRRRPLTEAELKVDWKKIAEVKAKKAQDRRVKHIQAMRSAPSSGFGLVDQPCPEGAEGGRGALPPAALDNNSQGGPSSQGSEAQGVLVHGKKVWSRRQKRGYQKVRSFLTVQEAKGNQAAFVTLTGAEGADVSRLRSDRKVLLKRVARHLGYVDIEVLSIQTDEGNGVLHELWGWHVRPGERSRRFYIPQKWLSKNWEEIHGAKIVVIKAYRYGDQSRRRLSRYLISQYLGDQCGYVNSTVSWKKTFGFPLRKTWERMLSVWRLRNNQRVQEGWPVLSFNLVLDLWESVLRGDIVQMGQETFCLGNIG
jgi:hypothetical protein